MDSLLGGLLAFGIAGLATAWCVWVWRWKADSGDHRLARFYHHYLRFQRWPHRNSVAFMPLLAAWGYLFGIAIVLAELYGDSLAPWPFFVVGFALFLLMLVALIRPPGWLYPPWFREARRREKAGLPSNVPVPPEGRRPVMTRRAYWLSVVGLVIFAGAWLYFGLPVGSLLIGLAVGVPVLLATRIKK